MLLQIAEPIDYFQSTGIDLNTIFQKIIIKLAKESEIRPKKLRVNAAYLVYSSIQISIT